MKLHVLEPHWQSILNFVTRRESELDTRTIEYMADVPANLRGYLNEPTIGLTIHSKRRQAKHERSYRPKLTGQAEKCARHA